MGNEVVIREPMVLTPAEVVENATTQARLLMDIVEKTKCYQNISGKKYLQVEAWETIGAFNRTHAETESITPIRGVDNNVDPTEIVGYQAHVQLWKDGVVVGGAMVPCYFTENCCMGKEGDAKHKSAMSAAQTFATSKAYRMNYSHVAILAGYQPLPAEEVTEDMRQSEPSHTEEHWCKKHNTKFFKTEKMKAWAHPVKNEDGSPTLDDKGKQIWCSEKAEPQAKKAEPEKQQEMPQEATEQVLQPQESPASIIDMEWLRESLEKMQWTSVGKHLREKYGVTGSRVSSMLGQLTPAQQKEFTEEVQSRLEASGF